MLPTMPCSEGASKAGDGQQGDKAELRQELDDQDRVRTAETVAVCIQGGYNRVETEKGLGHKTG